MSSSGLSDWLILLLEQPWVLVGVLVLAGFILWNLGQRRLDRRLQVLAGACITMAGCLVVLSLLLETAGETVKRFTTELVSATAPLDMGTVQQLVEPQARLLGPDNTVWIEAGSLLRVIEQSTRLHNLQSNMVQRFDILEKHKDRLVVQIRVRSVMEDGPFGEGIPTDWELTWTRSGERWQVTQIRWLSLANQPPGKYYLSQ